MNQNELRNDLFHKLCCTKKKFRAVCFASIHDLSCITNTERTCMLVVGRPPALTMKSHATFKKRSFYASSHMGHVGVPGPKGSWGPKCRSQSAVCERVWVWACFVEHITFGPSVSVTNPQSWPSFPISV